MSLCELFCLVIAHSPINYGLLRTRVICLFFDTDLCTHCRIYYSLDNRLILLCLGSEMQKLWWVFQSQSHCLAIAGVARVNSSLARLLSTPWNSICYYRSWRDNFRAGWSTNVSYLWIATFAGSKLPIYFLVLIRTNKFAKYIICYNLSNPDRIAHTKNVLRDLVLTAAAVLCACLQMFTFSSPISPHLYWWLH